MDGEYVLLVSLVLVGALSIMAVVALGGQVRGGSARLRMAAAPAIVFAGVDYASVPEDTNGSRFSVWAARFSEWASALREMEQVDHSVAMHSPPIVAKPELFESIPAAMRRRLDLWANTIAAHCNYEVLVTQILDHVTEEEVRHFAQTLGISYRKAEILIALYTRDAAAKAITEAP